MPGHHAVILTEASVAFFLGCVSCAFALTKCRSLGGMNGTTPLKMVPWCIVSTSFCCSNPFIASEHCFQLPLLICFMISWNSLFNPSSFYFSLSHQIFMNEVDVIDCEAHSIVVGFVCVSICSPGMYVNSKSKPIRAIAHLVILADGVFGISSSGAKRYLSDLWSVCSVNRLPRKNCFNLVTTKTIASASRSVFE